MHLVSGPGGGPDPEWFRRMMAPENEVPVALPMNTVLARTDDIALALVRLQVYSTGLSFDLIVRVRPGATGRLPVREAMWGHRHPFAPEPGGLLVGVELADGRRVTSLEMRDPRSEVVFTERESSWGDTGGEQSWWLNPLPPEGPLRFVVRCSEMDIRETSVELDGSAIRLAAGGVVTLWPWEPPSFDDAPEPPPQPDLPPESWFAR
jgi:hypothetical protein